MANPQVKLEIREGIPSLAEGQRDLYCPFSGGKRHCGLWCPLLVYKEGTGSTPDTITLNCVDGGLTYDVIIV